MKDANQRKETNENYLPPEDLLSAKQAEKLDLEIEGLRKKNRWELVVQLMPIIATLVGVAGFFFTVVEFESQRRAEQQKDRMSREVDQRTRLQNQIRADIDEVFRFTRDEKQTVSRVSFLLEDMKTVLNSHINETQRVSDIFPAYERSLTKSLVILVRDDCDFVKNPRDVGLANLAIGRWDDYSDYLKEELEKLDYILYEYIRALQNVRDQNPGYLETLKLDKKTDTYEVSRKYERHKNEPILYNHFVDIRDGFMMHIEILGRENLSEEAQRLKEKSLREFQSAMCNRAISEHTLGTYFPDQPCEKGR